MGNDDPLRIKNVGRKTNGLRLRLVRTRRRLPQNFSSTVTRITSAARSRKSDGSISLDLTSISLCIDSRAFIFLVLHIFIETPSTRKFVADALSQISV